MKVYVLVEFVDYEDSHIKGVMNLEENAWKWTEEQIKAWVNERDYPAETEKSITKLPKGFKFRDHGFIFEEWEVIQ